MALEIFVIYDKNTGYIEGGMGRIDKEKDIASADGISMRGAIKQILKNNKDLKVLYLPNQSLPERKEHKIVNDKIVALAGEDEQVFEERERRWDLSEDIQYLKNEMDAIREKITELRKQRSEVEL